MVSRTTGIDPYDVLSFAAVVNAGLLLTGIGALMAGFGEGQSSAAAVVVALLLFGGAPGFTCSYALADLPWIGVNSSAFSMGVTLWAWVFFRRKGEGLYRWIAVFAVAVMASAAMLDHGMVGVLTQVGLWLFAFTEETGHRRARCFEASIVSVATILLCAVWPWYSFFKIAIFSPLPTGVYSQGNLLRTLFQWCFPALLCSLLAFPYGKRKLVRVSLLGGYVCYLAGFIAIALPPWAPAAGTLARLPLPGLIFLHLAVAVFADRTGVLDPRSWPERLRRLASGQTSVAARAAPQALFGLLLIYCAVPEFLAIAREPYLARAYVAPILGKENKQLNLKHRFDVLLGPVGRRDVVLSDPVTSWPIPSSAGRIVYAIHPEWFVADESRRKADVDAFFTAGTTTARRIEILGRWSVKWIVLNRERVADDVFKMLYCEHAVVASDGDLVLMDARRWTEHVVPGHRRRRAS